MGKRLPDRLADQYLTVSVCVALEYRGHWVKIAQNAPNVRLFQTGFSEELYGPYSCAVTGAGVGGVFAHLCQYVKGGIRLFTAESDGM
jgi:hypothetical protein